MADAKKGFNILYVIIPIIIAVVVISVVVVVILVLPGGGGGAGGGDIAGTLDAVKGTLGDVTMSSTGLKNAIAAGTGVTDKADAFSSSVDDYAAQSAGVSDKIGSYTGNCNFEMLVAAMNNYDFSIAAALLYLEAYNTGDEAAKAQARQMLGGLLDAVGAEGGDIEQTIEGMSNCLGS